MATDVERLIVQLSADVRGFERSLARANGVTNRQFNQIERRARQFNSNLDGIGRNAARSFIAPLAGIGAALGTRELIRLADVWTDLTSRVNLASGSIEAGQATMERLGEVARRTYSSLEQTAEGYLQNSTALRELGYSTEQTLDYVEAVNNGLVISGARGQRAASVLDALSKALALGELRGENLNTVIQSGGRVSEALAAGLGVASTELRKLGQEGGIKTRDIIRALSSQMETLRDEAESLPGTITDGFQLLNDALLKYVGNADSATGVSAAIAEALTMIADNFENVADAGLRVAAVFAAGLLGRSVLGLIRTLGLGTAALANFTRALSAARTLGGLQIALTGLSAAAGPAGLVIGGGLATALVVAQANAQSAEERTSRLNAEFERLGLRGSQAAEGVEETAEALDRAADASRVQILKDVNAELDRLRGTGFNPFGNLFGNAEDQAKELGAIIRSAGNQLIGGTSADSSAYRQIIELAAAVRDQKIATDEALTSARAFAQTDLSDPVRRLNAELIQAIEYNAELNTAQFANADTTGLDNVIARIADVRAEVDYLAEAELITTEQQQQLTDIIDKLVETDGSADDTKDALAAIGGTNLRIDYILGQLNPLVALLGVVRQEAVAAAAAIGSVTPDQGLFDRSGRIQVAQEDAANRAAADAFEQAAARRAALSREELALETEIAKVRKDSADAGIRLTDDQARRIAQNNLNANARRTEESKKPPKERADEYERLTQRINESIAAQQAENATVAGSNPLINDYGFALEKARVQQDLLTAAKRAGLEVTPELEKEIDNLATAYAVATVEAAKLSESNEEIRRSAEEALDLARDVTGNLITGLIEGRSAADLMADSLKKIGDALLNDVLNNIFKINNAGGGGFFGNLLSLFGGGGGGFPLRPGGGAGSFFGGGLYATGGYTGDGGKYDIAGAVHRGEYVFDKEATARIGVGNLEALRKGFATGGYAGPSSLPTLSRPAGVATSQASNLTVNVNIEGANGDRHVMDLVQQGVTAGLRSFPQTQNFKSGVQASVTSLQGERGIR